MSIAAKINQAAGAVARAIFPPQRANPLQQMEARSLGLSGESIAELRQQAQARYRELPRLRDAAKAAGQTLRDAQLAAARGERPQQAVTLAEHAFRAASVALTACERLAQFLKNTAPQHLRDERLAAKKRLVELTTRRSAAERELAETEPAIVRLAKAHAEFAKQEPDRLDRQRQRDLELSQFEAERALNGKRRERDDLAAELAQLLADIPAAEAELAKLDQGLIEA